MVVFFWYLVKRDLSSVYNIPEQHGHVYLVGLYKKLKIFDLYRKVSHDNEYWIIISLWVEFLLKALYNTF